MALCIEICLTEVGEQKDEIPWVFTCSVVYGIYGYLREIPSSDFEIVVIRGQESLCLMGPKRILTDFVL